VYRLLVSYVVLDVPTSKFGDALRAQVEERLNFFETGAPPSKNADAIRRVLDDLALEDGDEDADEMADAEPILTTLEPTPRKEKKKKRKSEAMDVDEDDEGPSSKKVKLSKEEKKALKRAKKEKKEAKKALADVSVSLFVLFTSLTHITTARGCPQKEERGQEGIGGCECKFVCLVYISYSHHYSTRMSPKRRKRKRKRRRARHNEPSRIFCSARSLSYHLHILPVRRILLYIHHVATCYTNRYRITMRGMKYNIYSHG